MNPPPSVLSDVNSAVCPADTNGNKINFLVVLTPTASETSNIQSGWVEPIPILLNAAFPEIQSKETDSVIIVVLIPTFANVEIPVCVNTFPARSPVTLPVKSEFIEETFKFPPIVRSFVTFAAPNTF